MSFTTGSKGDRISENVIIASIDGVELQKLEVYKGGKFITEFTADELAEWETVIETSKTFSDNGTYTFKLTDKFGNTYETQIEKYYKVNVALILLLVLIASLIVVLIVTIIKARHKIKVR